MIFQILDDKERCFGIYRNGEFIYDLNFSRFGSSIHNLRREGWDIVTLPSKKKGLCFYYLRSLPSEVEKQTQLRLVSNES